MIVFLLAAIALAGTSPGLSDSSASARAPVDLWGSLIPGPEGVGYRRLDAGQGTVDAWYPARAGGEELRFRDYLGDGASRLAAFLEGTGVADTTVERLFGAPLGARKAASPAEGRFPIVLVAQGNGGDAIDQVVMCEHLASYGLVVVTTPSPTIETPLERETQVGAFAERQASDLLAAADAVAERLPADRRHVGVVGHSFGARAALLIAMRDPRVQAIVSLDGGIGTATAVEPLRAAPSFDAEADLPPVLHFFERLDPFMEPDFALLESLHIEELTLEPTAGMHHVHFTTYGFAAAALPEIASVTHATAETARNVMAVEERTVSFLVDRLRGKSLERRKPQESGRR